MGSKLKTYLLLHVLFLFYSFSGIVSKYTAEMEFLSLPFILLYGVIILILGIYAIGWQQVLKHLPLTSAYANRAVVIVWGIIWGFVFFAEPITWQKIVGALLIMTGVVIFAKVDGPNEDEVMV